MQDLESESSSSSHRPHQLLPPIHHQAPTMPSQHAPPPHQHPYPPPPYAGHAPPPPPQYMYGGGGGLAMHHAPLMPSNAGQLRYPIPQAPMNPQARLKKDIKKRTKTGCLTCRKRRIKCDEYKPTCRNCQKSKRECLGYDPVFKEPAAGTPFIQPAPSNSSTPPPLPPSYPATPPDPYAAVAAGASYLPAASPDAALLHFDPALAAGSHATMPPPAYPPLLVARHVIPITIDDLFALNDIPPQFQQRTTPPHLEPAAQQEINDFFTYHYAGGLDRLLETTWYTTHGSAHMNRDPSLQDFVHQCVERFKTRNDDPNATKPIPSLEARLVWQLACMPRKTPNQTLPPTLLTRLDIIENLLTGTFLDPQKIPSPAYQGSSNEQQYEQLYWHDLGRFTAARDDGSDRAAQDEINGALGRMRGYLGMMENRDVLYSIAIVRHIGGRMPNFYPHRQLVATSNDPMDDINKLKVAQNHVQSEDQRGLTQVIQRICGMALRGWALQKA